MMQMIVGENFLQRITIVHLQRWFDDALFADCDGLISEGATWNIGFATGDRVIWPRAPRLAGVAQDLIDEGLAEVGLTAETREVRLLDLALFDAAFICNSASPACPVAAIADRTFQADPALIGRLTQAWASRPLQPF
jgi:branched-subunit amino acid aminotransferase/4-amino-4-deoxychorismate lyase